MDLGFSLFDAEFYALFDGVIFKIDILQFFKIQWCPDISPGPVQPDKGTIRGVGHKAVLLPLRCIWLK